MSAKEPRGQTATQTAPSGIPKLEFDKDTAFQTELRRRVDDYLQVTGRSKRGNREMYVKSAIILSLFVTSYILLVFVARTLWQGLLLAVALALCTAAIGFNIQHDGGHHAYSGRRWVRQFRPMAMEAQRDPSQVCQHHRL